VRVVIGFGLKTQAKPTKTHKITHAPHAFSNAQGAWAAPKAHGFASLAQFLWFSSFLGLRLQITCLETWEQNSFHCKVSWGLLNLHNLVFPKSSKFLRCSWFADLHDFFVNYFKKNPKIAMFWENKNYRLKYRKHYKSPEIIANHSNTPAFFLL